MSTGQRQATVLRAVGVLFVAQTAVESGVAASTARVEPGSISLAVEGSRASVGCRVRLVQGVVPARSLCVEVSDLLFSVQPQSAEEGLSGGGALRVEFRVLPVGGCGM